MVNIDYLYNPDAAKPYFNKNYFIDKKLGFQVIENGMIIPYYTATNGVLINNGIVDSNGKLVKSSCFLYGLGRDYTPSTESIQQSSETVIYVGMFHSCYGHVLTDDIRRVWFLKSEIFKKEFKNCPLVYISRRGSVPLDLASLLKILEIDVDRLRPITQPTQFDKIILPDESFLSPKNPSVGITAEYIESMEILRNFALKNRTPTSMKKCYFFYGNKGIGEERLAEYFKSKGYAIITHKQRSNFYEELNILINCESFAAPLGSCSHNSVFLRNGTEAVFIPRVFYSETIAYQEMENLVHLLNVNYVDSTLSIFAPTTSKGPFVFIISEQLKRFFGDKWNGYEEEDFNLFLQYVKDSMNQGLPVIPQARYYYTPILSDFMTQLKWRKDLIKAHDMPPDWDKFKLIYQTHVHIRGWRDGLKFENQISNPLDQKLEVLAIKVSYSGCKVYYSVYYNEEEGWTEEVSDNKWAGITNKQKPIYGMKIRFDEAGAKEFDILYRMHKFDDEWTDWAKNGEELLSHGIKLNAIQIKLEPVKKQIDEVEQKKSDATPTPQPVDTPQNKLDDTWTLEARNDDSFYLQGQRQDLTQIKL